jgi:hypothetical protein
MEEKSTHAPQKLDGRMRPSLHDQLRAGIALREKLEPRGAQRDRGNRGASEGGCRALFGWALRLRSGEDTPALHNFDYRILTTNASVATRSQNT